MPLYVEKKCRFGQVLPKWKIGLVKLLRSRSGALVIQKEVFSASEVVA